MRRAYGVVIRDLRTGGVRREVAYLTDEEAQTLLDLGASMDPEETVKLADRRGRVMKPVPGIQ